MARLKLLETDNPLDVRREETAVISAAIEEAPKRQSGEGGGTRPAARRRVPRQSPQPLTAAARKAAHPPPEPASFRGLRHELPVMFVPAVLASLERRVDELRENGQRVSRNALAQAVLHASTPRDLAAARDLVKQWRLLRASEEWPYATEPAIERKLRVYGLQKELLDGHARGLRENGIGHGRSLLVNAIFHFAGPADVASATLIVREWNTLLASC